MSGALTFDPLPHEYQVDGVVVPNVTRILEDCGIVDYSYIPWLTRVMALERGRNVHTATHFDDEGDLQDETVDIEIAQYLSAWRNFRKSTGFTPELIEFRSFHPEYRYAGTLDRTGRFPGQVGSLALLDIKTNSAEWWVRLQLAAYAAFFPNPRTYRRICVELHADETYRLIEFPSREWLADFNAFLAALSVYNLKRQYGNGRRLAA